MPVEDVFKVNQAIFPVTPVEPEMPSLGERISNWFTGGTPAAYNPPTGEAYVDLSKPLAIDTALDDLGAKVATTAAAARDAVAAPFVAVGSAAKSVGVYIIIALVLVLLIVFFGNRLASKTLGV